MGMRADLFVMSVGTRVCPKKAAVDYGDGILEKESGCCYFLVKNENDKKYIVSGSGKAENYGFPIGKHLDVEVQGQYHRTKMWTVLNTCDGSDELPKFGAGSFPFYVMK